MKTYLLFTFLLFGVSQAQERAPNPSKDKVEQPRKARILCLGDSITEAGGTFKVFRPILAEKLAEAGIAVDFIGPKTDKSGLAHGGVMIWAVASGGADAPELLLLKSIHEAAKRPLPASIENP